MRARENVMSSILQTKKMWQIRLFGLRENGNRTERIERILTIVLSINQNMQTNADSVLAIETIIVVNTFFRGNENRKYFLILEHIWVTCDYINFIRFFIIFWPNLRFITAYLITVSLFLYVFWHFIILIAQ